MSTTLGLATEDFVTTAVSQVSGGVHPDLTVHDALGLATDAALTAHENDTTAVHGIADTSTLVLTNDSRLSDARTPVAHAHLDADIPAGIARDAEVATAVSDHAALADPHPGYLTSAEGNAAYQPVDSDLTAIAALATTAFGRGLLALADAAALAANHTHPGASTAYAPGSFTVATGNYAVMVKRLELTTTQRSTLQGTARLRID